MLKIIKNISQGKNVSIEEWKKKYKNTSLGGWGFEELRGWSKTLKNEKIKQEVNKALKIFEKHEDTLKSK